MNPYYYNTFHHRNLQPHYHLEEPLFPPPPLVLPPARYTIYSPPPVEYVDEVVIINNPSNAMNQNPYTSLPEDALEFRHFLEEGVILHDLEVESAVRRAASTNRGSGLPEEVISKRLLVYTLQGNMVANGEHDSCSICLGDYEKNEKMGRVECGHRFHANCIKQWLKSKNECPMCRSTALTV